MLVASGGIFEDLMSILWVLHSDLIMKKRIYKVTILKYILRAFDRNMSIH